MYFVGIDLGGTNIAAGILDQSMTILKKGSVPTGNERHYTEIVKDMGMLVLEMMKQMGISENQIQSIGIGSPGICDRENGVLLYNNNLRFRDVPLRAELQKVLRVPVYIENDANCAALAESMTGAAQDVADSITVTLGTGVGGGIVINNRIFTGFNGMGGEIGHAAIQQGGEECTCGRRGCWEAYASATALIRQTRRAAEQNPDSVIHRLVSGDLNKLNAKTAFDAMRENDETGRFVVDEYIGYIAEGLANMINILQPAKAVIGGGVSKEGETLLLPLRQKVRKLTYFGEGNVPQTQIVRAEMGNDAGIVGAAGLGVMHRSEV